MSRDAERGRQPPDAPGVLRRDQPGRPAAPQPAGRGVGRLADRRGRDCQGSLVSHVVASTPPAIAGYGPWSAASPSISRPRLAWLASNIAHDERLPDGAANDTAERARLARAGPPPATAVAARAAPSGAGPGRCSSRSSAASCGSTG